MRRDVDRWPIARLRNRFLSISFPEYQREANVWTLVDKQALIDSILRQFDIASFYFYETDDDSWDCIDGRQRINALMSFLGETEPDEDPHHGFRIRNTNEIDPGGEHPFPSVNGLTFEQLEARAGGNAGDNVGPEDIEEATRAKDRMLDFEITVVLLSAANHPVEFNLQFTRLNLGTPINAAEKLNAMTGEIRNLCFEDAQVGKHAFVQSLGLPNRRFAKEMTAAQILAQVFSKGADRDGEFVRTRHWELQDFFKEQFTIDAAQRPLVGQVAATLDALNGAIPNASELLRNRAITVSLVLYAWEARLYDDPDKLERLPEFLNTLLDDLRQLREALNSPDAVPEELRYLLDFQRHLTQAAVEKRAVRERAKDFEELFDRWMRHSRIRPLSRA